MSYSKSEIKDQQEKAILAFVGVMFDDEGDVGLLDPLQMQHYLRILARKFGYEIIPFHHRAQKEESTIKAILNAIRTLERMGERLSVAKISKLVRMNHWSCRQLMVKYKLFDVETKKVKNYYDNWNGEA